MMKPLIIVLTVCLAVLVNTSLSLMTVISWFAIGYFALQIVDHCWVWLADNLHEGDVRRFCCSIGSVFKPNGH